MNVLDKIKGILPKKENAVEPEIAPAPVSKKGENIIEIKGITKVFDGVTVLDDLSLGIKRGQFVTLLGPSG